MKDNQFILRTATANDIPDIMKIELSSFARGVCETPEIFSERVQLFSNGFCILQINNKVSGYICSELWDYKAARTADDFILGHSIRHVHNPQGNELYISSLGVMPSLRGKGWGNLLFNNFLQRMVIKYNNLRSVILIVSEKWNSARKIYRKNGFKEILLIRDFFENKGQSSSKEAGIVMRKNI